MPPFAPRKSTDQTGVAEEAKSVPLQIENATAFIQSKGWTVGPIFKDDGVSGAEFGERRPGFVALMDALRPSPPFQALVMSEESRLGRSTDMVPYVLAKLTNAGIQVWCYRENRKIALETPIEKFMVSATSFAADMERWLATQRTSEKMLQKARAGHVIGYRRCRVSPRRGGRTRRPRSRRGGAAGRDSSLRAGGGAPRHEPDCADAEGRGCPLPGAATRGGSGRMVCRHGAHRAAPRTL